jgi:pSer/pThr/pTyr-binding forkhead associated (FHA) protein
VTKLVFVLVVSGPLKGHNYFVKSDTPILVGRSNEAIIKISYDNFCSRRHALLYWENNTGFIKDLNSTNGTFVNNKRISQPTELHDGDIIGLGDTKLVVSVKDISEGDKAPEGNDIFCEN